MEARNVRDYITLEDLKKYFKTYVPHNLPDLHIHRVPKSWRPPPDQRRFSDISDEEELKLLKLPQLPTIFSPHKRVKLPSHFMKREDLPKNYQKFHERDTNMTDGMVVVNAPESAVHDSEYGSLINMTVDHENPLNFNDQSELAVNVSPNSSSTGDCTSKITNLHVSEQTPEDQQPQRANLTTLQSKRKQSRCDREQEYSSGFAADLSSDFSPSTRSAKRRWKETNVKESSSETDLHVQHVQQEVCRRERRGASRQNGTQASRNRRLMMKKRLAAASTRRKYRQKMVKKGDKIFLQPLISKRGSSNTSHDEEQE